MATERRVFAGSLLQVREDGDGRTVTGLAAPYNQPTAIGDRFTETLVRGSFDLSGGVPLHAGHDSELPVSPPGRMWEHGDGLYGEWKISRTTAGDDLLTLIGDRAVRGLSVSFEPNQSRDLWDGRGAVTRYHCRLLNVAAVTRPAYAGAQVLSVRAGIRFADDEPQRTSGPVAAQLMERRGRLYRAQDGWAPSWQEVRTGYQAQLELGRR